MHTYIHTYMQMLRSRVSTLGSELESSRADILRLNAIQSELMAVKRENADLRTSQSSIAKNQDEFDESWDVLQSEQARLEHEQKEVISERYRLKLGQEVRVCVCMYVFMYVCM